MQEKSHELATDLIRSDDWPYIFADILIAANYRARQIVRYFLANRELAEEREIEVAKARPVECVVSRIAPVRCLAVRIQRLGDV